MSATVKPLPCKEDALRQALQGVWASSRQRRDKGDEHDDDDTPEHNLPKISDTEDPTDEQSVLSTAERLQPTNNLCPITPIY